MSIEKTIEQRLERIEQLTQLSLLAAKEALTMDEGAAYTGLSKSYLYRLVCKKQIPYYKSKGGKQTYFDKTELCNWLLNHRVPTAEETQQAAIAYVVNNPRNGRKGGAK
jgi:excisionase family DNA binding protein